MTTSETAIDDRHGHRRDRQSERPQHAAQNLRREQVFGEDVPVEIAVDRHGMAGLRRQDGENDDRDPPPGMAAGHDPVQADVRG